MLEQDIKRASNCNKHGLKAQKFCFFFGKHDSYTKLHILMALQNSDIKMGDIIYVLFAISLNFRSQLHHHIVLLNYHANVMMNKNADKL